MKSVIEEGRIRIKKLKSGANILGIPKPKAKRKDSPSIIFNGFGINRLSESFKNLPKKRMFKINEISINEINLNIMFLLRVNKKRKYHFPV
ncbi:MAG: hypothetical protein ACRC0V_09520 [Fusobacteriaceae bacterium]